MGLKFLILLLFAAIILSLFSGLYFLIRDQGRTRRTVTSLFFRVGFSVLLFLLLLVSFYSGYL